MPENNSSKLTKLFVKFKKTNNNIDYKMLYEEILLYAYKFPLLLSNKNAHHTGAFALFIQDKIYKIIHRFNFYGIPLENYLYIVLKGQFFTYLKHYLFQEKKQSINTIYGYCRSLDIPTFVTETNVDYKKNTHEDFQSPFPMENVNSILSINSLGKLFKNTYQYKTFCKRMWIYILKHSSYFDDEVVVHCALQVNIDADTCLKTLQLLTAERHTRRHKQEEQDQRCTVVFSKYLEKTLLYQEQYEYFTEHEKNKLLNQINEVHATYQKLIHRKQEKKYTIPNQVLSRVLHIPKGSIDSSIYHLKRMCKSILAKNSGKKNQRHRPHTQHGNQTSIMFNHT